MPKWISPDSVLDYVIGPDEVAEMTGTSLRNVHRLLLTGRIKSKKLGTGPTSARVVSKPSVEAYLQEKRARSVR